MNKKDKTDFKENIEAPSCEPVFGQPEDCHELINKYGTYNIQPTSDTSNEFPAISHGLSKEEKEKVERERRKWKSDCDNKARERDE